VDAIDDASENGEPNCDIDSSIAQCTSFFGVSAIAVSVEAGRTEDATETCDQAQKPSSDWLPIYPEVCLPDATASVCCILPRSVFDLCFLILGNAGGHCDAPIPRIRRYGSS
jgi:hypothetical protein